MTSCSRFAVRVFAGVLAVAAFAACSPKKEDGACILSYGHGQAEQCRMGASEDLCKKFGEPSASMPDQSSRFEPVSKEDREGWEKVKSSGGDVTALTCHRLGFMHCSQASRICTLR